MLVLSPGHEATLVDKLEKEIKEVPDLKAMKQRYVGAAWVEFEDFVSSTELPDRFIRCDDACKIEMICPMVSSIAGFSDVYFSMMALTAEDQNQRDLIL